MSTVSVASPTPELVIAAGVTLPLICTVAVVLRLLNSRFIDDWLTIPSLALLWGQGICLIYGTVKHALGYFPADAPQGVDPDTYVSPEGILASKLLYTMILIQIPCLTLIKLSFVFFYRRVFASRRTTQSPYLATFLNAVAGILILWAVGFWFTQLFVCRTDFGVIFYGTNEQQEAACLPFTPFDQAYAASDFVLDLLVFLLPVPLVMKLQISRGRQLGLLGVFSLGGLAIAASITRFIVFTYDDIMGFTTCLYWTCLESGIALLASCLPSIYGLLNNAKRSRSSAKASGYGYGYGGGGRSSMLNKGRNRLASNDSQAGPPRMAWKENGDITVTHEISVDTEIGLEELGRERGRR